MRTAACYHGDPGDFCNRSRGVVDGATGGGREARDFCNRGLWRTPHEPRPPPERWGPHCCPGNNGGFGVLWKQRRRLQLPTFPSRVPIWRSRMGGSCLVGNLVTRAETLYTGRRHGGSAAGLSLHSDDDYGDHGHDCPANRPFWGRHPLPPLRGFCWFSPRLFGWRGRGGVLLRRDHHRCDLNRSEFRLLVVYRPRNSKTSEGEKSWTSR